MVTIDRSSSALQADVRHLARAAEDVDGVAPLDEAALLALDPAGSAAEPVHLCVRDESGALWGYASILADGTLQGMVDPGHRRAGIGTALLDAALARRPDASVWAHGALDGSLDFLTGAGFSARRTLLVLGRALPADDLPAPAQDAGAARITTFDLERDGQEWVAVNSQAFVDHPEQGRMTLGDLEERTRLPWFDPEGFLLARDGGELLGFVWTKTEGPAAEIYVVGTAPAAQGRGVARLLLHRALEHLGARGASQVELYVDGDNHPALALYRRMGFEVTGRHVQLSRGTGL